MAWRTEALDHRVAAELGELPADVRAGLDHVIALMEQYGPERVGEPRVEHLGEKLWEIRVRGRAGVPGVIHVPASGRRSVLRHAFVTKPQQTRRRAPDLAAKRAKDVT